MTGILESTQYAMDAALYQFGQDNSIDIALEGQGYEPDAATPYLSGHYLPAPTEQADLYWTERRRAIYQVDVSYPQLAGTADLNATCDAVNASFKAGSTFTNGNIGVEVTSVDFGPLITQNGWATRPVSINIEAYTWRL